MNRVRVILKPLLAMTFHLNVSLEKKKLSRIFMAPSPHNSVMAENLNNPFYLLSDNGRTDF